MPQVPKSQNTQIRRALTLDVEKYQHMLDAPDLSDAEKTDLINAMWSLVVNFIDAGIDVRPAENCGKPVQDAITPDSDKATMLDSFQSQATITPKTAANADMRRKEAS